MTTKPGRTPDRKARAAQLRAEQERLERRRSRAILIASILVVGALLASALVPYLRDRAQRRAVAHAAVESLGAPLSAAGCTPVATRTPKGLDVSGPKGNHTAMGARIRYADAPPAFGRHWPIPLRDTRAFYGPADRPAVELMVHNEEHGSTLVWYDDTVRPGSAAYRALQAIAAKYDDLGVFLSVLPWKAADGRPFPAGKHVAITHWSAAGGQRGIWQYCARPSGAAIKKFVTTYPATDAPEVVRAR